MNSGMDNQKQLAVAGFLGIGCLAAIGNAMWQVHAAHSAPAPLAAAATPAAAAGSNPAPPAASTPAPPANPSPAGAVGAAVAAPPVKEADLVPLPPPQLRNPFQGPGDTALAAPVPVKAPVPSAAAPAHSGLGSAVVSLARAVAHPTPADQLSPPQPAAPRSRRARFQPQQPQWMSASLPPALPPAVPTTFQPRVSNTQAISVGSNNAVGNRMGGGINPAPPQVVTPVPPPTPAQVYETDAATLRSSVVVRGVLVGAPSAAFVTINGAQQVVHQGDLLPGGFQVAAITDTGIVVFYSKSAGLNKSFALAL